MQLPYLNDTLETKRCFLKIPQESEAEYIWNLITENTTKYMIWAKGENFSTTLENIQKTREKTKKGLSWDAAVYEKNSGKCIGRCGINKTDASIPSYEIGYWITEEYWGKGIIPECVESLTKYAFELGGFEKGVIRCNSENINSAKVALKCGFKFEGEFRKDENIRGVFRDTKYFGITKEDYFSQK